MISGAGERRMPAGVSGAVGRGTVGTDALAGRVHVLLWVAVTVYVLAGAGVLVGAVLLAPWGLLLVIPAAAFWAAALIAVAFASGLRAEASR